MPFWIWIIVMVVALSVEAFTLEMVSVWFGIGSIIPLILSACDVGSWELHIILFIIISAVLILSLRKIAIKFLLKNAQGKTNLDAIIGKVYRLIDRTDFETRGSVKINDVIWSVEGVNQETIEANELVEVVSISGNKLKVKKVNNKIENKEDSLKEKTNNKKSTNKKEK